MANPQTPAPTNPAAAEYRLVTYHGGESFTASTGRHFEKGKPQKMLLREAQDYTGRSGFNVDPVPSAKAKPGTKEAARAVNARAAQAEPEPPPLATEGVPPEDGEGEQTDAPEPDDEQVDTGATEDVPPATEAAVPSPMPTPTPKPAPAAKKAATPAKPKPATPKPAAGKS